MEADIFHLGSWKNIKELEDALTLDELYLLREGLFRSEHRRNKFMAAMKGVDIDEGTQEESAFDRIQREATATLAGKSEEEVTFDMLGISYEAD